MIVIQPAYFAPISQFAIITKHKKVCLEVCDNYQKQTYRNRCYIYGANGKLMLNIPIIHSKRKGQRQLTRAVLTDTRTNWQKQHLKSIKTAYQTSPYFEFYEDDICTFYQQNFKSLQAVNIATLKLILELLEINVKICYTDKYCHEYKADYRCLVNAKTNHNFTFYSYTQVFQNKFGFISNLSILDLLFMEGPNAINYLENGVKERV